MWLAPMFRNRPPRDPNQPRWKFTVLALMAVSLVIVLLPFIYTGTFSRYQADDYCSAELLRTNGFMDAQIKSFVTWSNRFSTMLVNGLVDPLDVLGMQILPALLIIGLLISAFILLRNLHQAQGWSLSDLELFSLAGLVTFISIYTAPDQFQSFYWRSGSVTYALPIIGIFILSAVLVRTTKHKSPIWALIMLGLLAFFNGGFSETTTALQAATLMLGLGLAYWRNRVGGSRVHQYEPILAAGIGTLAALVLMVVSPGNAVRMSQMPEQPGLLEWIFLSFRFGAGFVYQSITSYPLTILVTAITGFSLAQQQDWKGINPRNWSWLFWAIPVGIYLLIVASTAPSAFAQGAYPEDRAMIPARFILTGGIAALAYLIGMVYLHYRQQADKFQLRPAQSFNAFILVMMCFYFFYGGLQTLARIPEYMDRASAWDERAEVIATNRLAGQMDQIVLAYDSMGRVRELADDPDHWVNRCAAGYYQLDSIQAK